MKSVYFPNLNGIRFLAAFGVIVHHIELHKYILKEPNRWHLPFFDLIGKVCVILFFVLSGFLITFLLLKERERTGKIAVREFYLRRVLRIWPLYYLLAAVGLFVLPHLEWFRLPFYSELLYEGFTKKILLIGIILPNLVTVPIPGIYQLWSIGVEEQFYLIWPVLVRKFRNPLLACLIVIAGYLFVKFGVLPLIGMAMHHSDSFELLARIWSRFSIDCMAIGGIAAWLLYRGDEVVQRVIFSPLTQVLVYTGTVLLIGFGVVIPYFNFEMYAILFAILLVNLAANPATLIRLETPVFRYLGKISYGIYMYHLIGIALAHGLTTRFAPGNDALLYFLSISLTLGLAALSYQFIESRFISLKSRFTVVASGEEARRNTVPSPEPAALVNSRTELQSRKG